MASRGAQRVSPRARDDTRPGIRRRAAAADPAQRAARTQPAVTPTNLLFNVAAVPGGLLRFWHERRLLNTLTGLLVAGTLPGGDRRGDHRSDELGVGALPARESKSGSVGTSGSRRLALRREAASSRHTHAPLLEEDLNSRAVHLLNEGWIGRDLNAGQEQFVG